MSKVLLDMSVSLDRFVAESVSNTGAILLGRQTYDQGDGLDGFAGSPDAVERFVVTHSTPERAAKGQMTFTFVTEGVEVPSSGRTRPSGPLLR